MKIDNDLNQKLISAITDKKIDDVKAIVAQGADVKAMVGHVTPLHCGVMYSTYEIYEYLIQHGAELEHINGYGTSAVKYIFTCPNEQIKKDIIANIKFIDQGFPSDKTLLHYVVANCSKDLVYKVLDHGGDINIRDVYGNTPLHYAVNAGLTENVEVLLEAGADQHIINNNGENPRDIANRVGSAALKDFLEKYDEDTIDAQDSLVEIFIDIVQLAKVNHNIQGNILNAFIFGEGIFQVDNFDNLIRENMGKLFSYD
jgi:ankyrin repeat protein